ncbi:MAG: TraR/DksA C4-type zinc finger protein [Deltaproteobacteria bacterium]|nr:TraR/DksA C4-type zinc finger protein [Deltaproteobacteria bacterium]
MMIDYDKMIAFHGHSCPGLAMGYRMTTAAMNYLSQYRSEDEELVAITENNACGVDALQFISGCTFGKGNLIFKDYGKQAYTFYSRKNGQGIRVVLNQAAIPGDLRSNRQAFIDWLLAADEAEIVSLQPVTIDEPEKARVMASVVCDFCGEAVMETRITSQQGKNICIPCREKKA